MRSLFLLALTALIAAPALAQTAVEVRVENPLDQPRPDEVVELDWSDLRNRMPRIAEDNVRVVDAGSGDEVLTQVFDADADGQPDALLFLADLGASASHRYMVEAAPSALEASARSYARYDPPRDDMAWESDRIAYRTYGQGLWQNDEYQPLVSSGIDVWPKRTRDLILDRWYDKGHDAYHIDTGEGADFFSVGPTLGAGGTAVWRGDSLYRAENFAGHRIIADGPIRTVFEMMYEPWDAAGISVSETKRITIDAGHNLFRSESTFETGGADVLTVAIGVVKREGVVGSTKQTSPDWAWLSAWGPVERKNGGHGDLGTAALLDRSRLDDVRETNEHYLALLTATPGEPVVHYAGAGWTASGDFDGVQDWWAHLDALAQRLDNPVRVTLSTATP